MPTQTAAEEARDFVESLREKDGINVDDVAGCKKDDEEAYLAACFEQDRREEAERQRRRR